MAVYETVILDQNSLPVAGALGYIYVDGNLASLTDDLGAALKNPIVSDANGRAKATVPSWSYVVRWYWAGKERLVEEKNEGLDPTVTQVEGLVASASNSAAYAEAMTGPTYASTAAGLAATTSGKGFAVNNGDGTVTVYLNNAGSAVAQRTLATTAYLASTSGANLIGFTASGVGAIARTVRDKLRATVTPEDFGAIGDGLTHPLSTRYASLAAAQVDFPFATALTQEIDYCAIMAAINSQQFGTGYYISGPEIVLRNGATYYMGSDTIQLKRSIRMRGAGSGLPWTSMAALKWAAGATGIIVHRYNTFNSTVEGTPTTAGDASIFEGFRMLGSSSAAADANGGHAFWLRARATCRDIYIESWKGNGYNIVAAAGGGGALEGNANNWRVCGGRVQGCENGFYVSGADANAGMADGVDVSSNRIWGVSDRSFLGNTWISMHAAANGINAAATQSAYATYGGKTYHAVPGNSSATLGSTEPGTNTNVWRECNGTGYAYAWTGSNPAGTFREGGGYMSNNANARCTFIGCYVEGGQGLTWPSTHSIVIGGFMIECPVSSGAAIEGRFGANWSRQGFVSERTRLSDGRRVKATLGGDNNTLTAFDWTDSNDNVVYRWSAMSGGGWEMTRNASSMGIAVRSQAETVLPNTFALAALAHGQGSSIRLFGRNTWFPDGFPTSGTYQRGDAVLYAWGLAPSGKIGFVCTTAGTAGSTAVFKDFGAIDA